jgi:hypothetical protein
MDDIVVRTNNKPRLIIDDYELTPAERAEFDYIDWDASAKAEFFRYKGQLYDMGEFMTTVTLPESNPLQKWHAYYSDSWARS